MIQKIRELTLNLTVYGVGDVAIQLAGFLLLPLYVRVLSPTDYGVITVLLIVEQVLRVLYRWGIDAAFMRFYYDCEDTAARRLLASTIFFFLIAVSGSVLAAGIAAAPWLARELFDSAQWVTPLRLVFLNAFLGCLSFLPFHVLRIEGRARTFVKLTFATNLSALLVKLALVAGLRLGVLGIFLADTIVAVGLAAAIAPRYAALIRPVFSRALLRSCLAFGLPRIPHGVAHQITAGADRYILNLYVPLSAVGVYGVGAGLGLGLKLFLSAFETAWAPFYFREMKAPDARRTFRTVTTYGILVLALLASGLAATATDLVRLMTKPQYYGAAAIVPWIGLSVALQGVYLLMSIGLNITKRTAYYPVATGAAALASVGFSLLLVPRYGMMGAAWSNVLAYAVLAGAGYGFSQRFYPIEYEWSRLARIVAAALMALIAGRVVLPPTAVPIAGLAVRGITVVAVFVTLLAATRFFHAREIQYARQVAAAWLARLNRRQVPS